MAKFQRFVQPKFQFNFQYEMYCWPVLLSCNVVVYQFTETAVNCMCKEKHTQSKYNNNKKKLIIHTKNHRVDLESTWALLINNISASLVFDSSKIVCRLNLTENTTHNTIISFAPHRFAYRSFGVLSILHVQIRRKIPCTFWYSVRLIRTCVRGT